MQLFLRRKNLEIEDIICTICATVFELKNEQAFYDTVSYMEITLCFLKRLIEIRKCIVIVKFFTMALFLMILHMIGASTFVIAFFALKRHELKKGKTLITKN